MSNSRVGGKAGGYGRFPAEFLLLPRYQNLPPATKGFLVLIHISAYHYPPGLLAAKLGGLEDETGYPRETMLAFLRELEEAEFIRHDPAARLAILYDAGWEPRSPDNAKGWLGRASALPDCELVAEYLEGLLALVEGKDYLEKALAKVRGDWSQDEKEPSKPAMELAALYLKLLERLKRLRAEYSAEPESESVTEKNKPELNPEPYSYSSSSSASGNASSRERDSSTSLERVGVVGSSLPAAASTSPEAAGARAPLEPFPKDLPAKVQELLSQRLPRLIAMDTTITGKRIKAVKDLWITEGWREKHFEAALDNFEALDWLPDPARKWFGAMRRMKQDSNPSVFAVGKAAIPDAIERKQITLRFEGTEGELLLAVPAIRARVEAAFSAEWETVEILEPEAEAAGA